VSGGYEILEHTADVGIRAWGDSLEEAFGHAARGLFELLGARADAPRERRSISLEGEDPEPLLVDFLNELLVIHEAEQVAFTDVTVRRTLDGLKAEVGLAPVEGETESVGVKAATYHQLQVLEHPGGRVEARVFLDV
jgi:SHS2 domain-containing protein